MAKEPPAQEDEEQKLCPLTIAVAEALKPTKLSFAQQVTIVGATQFFIEKWNELPDEWQKAFLTTFGTQTLSIILENRKAAQAFSPGCEPGGK